MEIIDESVMHAEHAAMKDQGYTETHFKLYFTVSYISLHLCQGIDRLRGIQRQTAGSTSSYGLFSSGR